MNSSKKEEKDVEVTVPSLKEKLDNKQTVLDSGGLPPHKRYILQMEIIQIERQIKRELRK